MFFSEEYKIIVKQITGKVADEVCNLETWKIIFHIFL